MNTRRDRQPRESTGSVATRFVKGLTYLVFLVGTTFRLLHEGISYARLLKALPYTLP